MHATAFDYRKKPKLVLKILPSGLNLKTCNSRYLASFWRYSVTCVLYQTPTFIADCIIILHSSADVYIKILNPILFSPSSLCNMAGNGYNYVSKLFLCILFILNALLLLCLTWKTNPYSFHWYDLWYIFKLT